MTKPGPQWGPRVTVLNTRPGDGRHKKHRAPPTAVASGSATEAGGGAATEGTESTMKSESDNTPGEGRPSAAEVAAEVEQLSEDAEQLITEV